MPATVYSNAIGKSCCIIHTHDAKRTRATHFLYSLEQARSYRSRIDSLAQYRRSLIHPSIRPSAESRLNIPMISRRGHVLVNWLVAADKSRARANLFCLLRETCRVATRPANFLTEIETSPAFSRIFQQVWLRGIARARAHARMCPCVFFSCTKFAISCPPDFVINVGVSLINESRARLAHTRAGKVHRVRRSTKAGMSVFVSRSCALVQRIYYFAALITHYTRDTRVSLACRVYLAAWRSYREPFTRKRRYVQRYDSETTRFSDKSKATA